MLFVFAQRRLFKLKDRGRVLPESLLFFSDAPGVLLHLPLHHQRFVPLLHDRRQRLLFRLQHNTYDVTHTVFRHTCDVTLTWRSASAILASSSSIRCRSCCSISCKHWHVSLRHWCIVTKPATQSVAHQKFNCSPIQRTHYDTFLEYKKYNLYVNKTRKYTKKCWTVWELCERERRQQAKNFEHNFVTIKWNSSSCKESMVNGID